MQGLLKKSSSCPFDQAHQLMDAMDQPCSYLPGYPQIDISDSTKSSELYEFLLAEFRNEELESISDHLWWMSKQDSANISPLHRQLVKQRRIIVTEDPKLHLVWIDDRIFIKPLPKYLLCYSFWESYLSQSAAAQSTQVDQIRRVALGYLRTYMWLIQYESDFRIAQEANLSLIQSTVSWTEFCSFTMDIARRITDAEVSGRYCYGELRLTRLNHYAPLLLGKTKFHRVHPQYGIYFARFYGPILFGFGFLSVALGGMQVILATTTVESGVNSKIMDACYWTSAMVIISTAA
ncbi:hypothetical protein N7528_009170 [Penicillium herquei]|nr:hypothetical protein N7528_009170 [Penicillium herquei]